MRIRQRRQRINRFAQFFLLCLGVSVLSVGLILAFALNGGAAASRWGPPDAGLSPLEGWALGVYLSVYAGELDKPAGADATPQTFSVQPGETAAQIAERLAEQKLVREARLLNFYWRYRGLDDRLEAGEFSLRQTMTGLEIAQALTQARAPDISVRLWEGWRLEQMADALSAVPALAVSREAYLALAGPAGPRPAQYPFLKDSPTGASLEGFLFPDTYHLAEATTAAEVIDRQLTNFAVQLPANYPVLMAQRQLTLYQIVTLASLIEREAAKDEERPIIASVIYNRLANQQPLEIDATVQYIVATSQNWWPPVADLDFRSIQNPYNTYTVTGLPAGPIANPGRASILAALQPAETDYFYYRARCDGSGYHNFAATYAEHLANACQ